MSDDPKDMSEDALQAFVNAEIKQALAERAEKARRLAAQWPKKCGCGRVYDVPIFPEPGAEEWSALPFAYEQKDAYATQEARHCSCGSTLVILTEIHDLKEE